MTTWPFEPTTLAMLRLQRFSMILGHSFVQITVRAPPPIDRLGDCHAECIAHDVLPGELRPQQPAHEWEVGIPRWEPGELEQLHDQAEAEGRSRQAYRRPPRPNQAERQVGRCG